MRKGLEILLTGILAVSTPNLVMGQQLASTQNTEQQAQDSRRALLYQIQQLEQEAKQKPTSMVYERISDLYCKLKEWDKALDTALKSSRLDSSRWEPHINISKCYNKLGERKKAITHAWSAVEIKENEHTYGNFAAIISNQGKYEEALSYFRKALKFNPNDNYAKNGESQMLNFLTQR